MIITSSDFNNRDMLNYEHGFGEGCGVENNNSGFINQIPSLAISNIPEDAQSLVLIMEDRDAVDFLHWLIHIPVPKNGEVVHISQGNIPEGSVQRENWLDNTNGYGGPCPGNEGGVHIYDFKVYAIDKTSLSSSDIADLREEINGSILAETILSAKFGNENNQISNLTIDSDNSAPGEIANYTITFTPKHTIKSWGAINIYMDLAFDITQSPYYNSQREYLLITQSDPISTEFSFTISDIVNPNEAGNYYIGVSTHGDIYNVYDLIEIIPQTLIITEFMANPADEIYKEWIEIKNISNENINLNNHDYSINGNSISSNIDILPGDYFVICEKMIWENCDIAIDSISLMNTGDTIVLKKDDNILDTISYEEDELTEKISRFLDQENNIWSNTIQADRNIYDIDHYGTPGEPNNFVFYNDPIIEKGTNNGEIDIEVSLYETGTGFYIILPADSRAPTKSEILGFNYVEQDVIVSGSGSFVIGYEDGIYKGNETISGLVNPYYDVYVVARSSDETETTDIFSVKGLKSHDNEAPSFEDSTPRVKSGENVGDLDIEIKLNETGTGYFLVVDQGSTKPTVDQVIAGNNYGDVIISESGSIVINDPDSSESDTINLDTEKSYDIHFVAEDVYGNRSGVVTVEKKSPKTDTYTETHTFTSGWHLFSLPGKFFGQ